MLYFCPYSFILCFQNFFAYFGANILFDRTYFIQNKIKITNEKYFSFLLKMTKKSMLFGSFLTILIYILINGIATILWLFTPLLSIYDLVISLSIGFPFILAIFIMFICCLCFIRSWKKINKTFEVTYEKFYEELSNNWENIKDIDLSILKAKRLMLKTDGKFYSVRRIMSIEHMLSLIKKNKDIFSISDIVDFTFYQRWEKFKIDNSYFNFKNYDSTKQKIVETLKESLNIVN
ncbi:hypothetical protein AB5V95_02865 [Metamycoplasma spumans]|uniref:hypothetical protein n=1 Tax=Metamycoplasma spumans TaxID=92406 RepID=UPI0034DCF920